MDPEELLKVDEPCVPEEKLDCTDPPKFRKHEMIDPLAPKPKTRIPKIPIEERCPSVTIEPTISHRVGVRYVPQGLKDDEPKPEYLLPQSKKLLEIRRKNYPDTAKIFCKFPTVGLDKPPGKRTVEEQLEVPSPEASVAKVQFKKTSPSPSWLFPNPPTDDDLDLKKPKSGIFLNVTDDGKPKMEPYDSFDLLSRKQPRPVWSDEPESRKEKNHKPKKSKKAKGDNLEAINEDDEGGTDGEPKKKKKKKKKKSGDGDKLEVQIIMPEIQEEDEMTKILRRKVSVLSAATSHNSGDGPGVSKSDVGTELPPTVERIVQKFRRDSEMKKYGPKRRRIRRGTLYSHSFTDICQPTLKDFFFGSKEGTMHQEDDSFPERVRNKQGACMPVAAYCYSVLKHPNKWTRENVDEILCYGNNFFTECLEAAYIQELKGELPLELLKKYITIGDKKVRFFIDDPDIAGYIRSDDKAVYNITKALGIFLDRHTAGFIYTKGLYIGIWKQKYIYMFDARPRTKDLYCSPTGAAIMAVFYDVQSLATVFLKRSYFGNWPFRIFPLRVFRVIDVNDLEVDSRIAINQRSEYNILNENKAVVLGSFDLGDKCFDFTRNKQSLPMSVLALVYSRITPPSAWHRKTIDKIMILGNLLYRETLCCSTTEQVKLENLPAFFTVGPYIVEIYIYGNVYTDVIYRSCVCQLQQPMELFFSKCTNGILQIGKNYLAIWKQRNMFYCFDPYSRNKEGYACRDGCACVSMHSTIESLMETIVHNFDRDSTFYIHALKVCKIHRDPMQTTAFPKNLTMDEFPLECFRKYKMQKSNKFATEKPITVEYTALAMRRLLAGEEPANSLFETGSHVGSLNMGVLKSYMKKCPSKPCICFHPQFPPDIADLESPSLEDTQVEPPLPQQLDEEIEFMDLDSFGPTMDELEMEDEFVDFVGGEYEAEVEGEEREQEEEEYSRFGEEEDMGEGEEGWYYGKGQYSQYDLASKISEQVNTDVTYFPIKRDILYPTYMRGNQQKCREEKYKLKDNDWENYLPPLPPDVTKSEELRVETNFMDLPDDTQLILGPRNVAELGETVEYIAPFVCIMACVVAKKYNITTWSCEIIDYILKCGKELYRASKFRYDQVSKLEIPRITLGTNVFSVLVEYVFDSYTRQNILELALDKILFVRSNTGVIVTPTYACAVMFKNHLYYLYDPFGNNEIGLSEGGGDKGVAIFARFKDLRSLTTRIMFNKQKRESAEEIVYSRFVLSSVKVKSVRDYAEKKKKKRDETEAAMGGKGAVTDEELAKQDGKAVEEPKPVPENRVGYHLEDKNWILVGTKGLPDREVKSAELKEDHFVCICACLMLLCTPVKRWTTKKVDKAIDYGVHVYSHADDLYISEKRTIKNILIGKYFFDIVVRLREIENYQANKDLGSGMETLFSRRFSYFLVQFPNACYAVHKCSKGMFHIFDPYGQPNDKPAGWLRCSTINELKNHMKKKMIPGCEAYKFYNFEVTTISKAPKSVILSHKLESYELQPRPAKKEKMGKPFYEDHEWLKMEPISWSRMNQKSASGKMRGTIETLWNSWDEEYPKDLWSLMGNINQRNERFAPKNRGKQTLSNLVTAIGMTSIYQLAEWNSAVVDSVLVNGEHYFIECTENISDPDYELAMDDLLPKCSIFPFTFNVSWKPVVEGTMFLVRTTHFNLYKALRYFFINTERRCGIIMLTKTAFKRQIAFGKLRESEYFVFDSDCRGTPMFVTNQDVAYILRMTTMNRLLHVLTLTLRGGDFYIYEVQTSDLTPLA